MASVSFDELIDFLLDQIALRGSQGRTKISVKRSCEKRQHEFDPRACLVFQKYFD